MVRLTGFEPVTYGLEVRCQRQTLGVGNYNVSRLER